MSNWKTQSAGDIIRDVESFRQASEAPARSPSPILSPAAFKEYVTTLVRGVAERSKDGKVRIELHHTTERHAPYRITRMYRHEGRVYLLKNIYGKKFTVEEAVTVICEMAADGGFRDYDTRVIV